MLANPSITKVLVQDAGTFTTPTEFVGPDEPSVLVNSRFAESVAALKALEAIYIDTLLHGKSEPPSARSIIDTDHA